MAVEQRHSSGASFLKTVLAGIIVLVVGGLILAYLQGWLFQDGSRPKRPESAAEGDVDPLSRNSGLNNLQSRIEISSVKINRAFEDYDSDISQLEKITAWRMLTWRVLNPKPPAIKLEFADIHNEDLAQWQLLINRQLSACGCTEGAILLMVTACGYVIYLIFLREEYTSIGWSIIGLGIGISFIAAIIGKLTGLVRSQIQLTRYVRRLKAVMNHITYK